MPHPSNPNDDLDLCRFHVSLDTTSHCNLRCRHCWMDAVRAMGYQFKNEIMPLDLFKRIADDFVGRCRSFGLSCGYEPLLNKQFDQYLAYAIQAGLPDVHFYTNGTLLQQEMADRIVAAGPARIVFSLEGSTEETFQDIRRGATLEKFLGAIDMIQRAKIEQNKPNPVIRLNWVAMPRNMHQLPDLARMAKEHGCTEIFLIPHIRWENAELQEDSVVAGHLDEARRYLNEFHYLCNGFGISVVDEMFQGAMPTEQPAHPTNGGRKKGLISWVERILAGPPQELPYCLQPWDMMIITSSGTIMPCSGVLIDRVYGDFSKQSLSEMWNSTGFRALRDGLTGRGKVCEHCSDCPHFRLNTKSQDFHKPRPLDVERLRQIIPSIVPKRETRGDS